MVNKWNWSINDLKWWSLQSRRPTLISFHPPRPLPSLYVPPVHVTITSSINYLIPEQTVTFTLISRQPYQTTEQPRLLFQHYSSFFQHPLAIIPKVILAGILSSTLVMNISFMTISVKSSNSIYIHITISLISNFKITTCNYSCSTSCLMS